jgi:gliding motility-associated-like protein
MRRLNFLITLSIGLIMAGRLNAQLLYNNGSQVAVTPGGILYVDGAAENAYGLLSNAGITTVVGNFTNNSTATGGDTTSYYNIYGDWINNGTFTANHDNVVMKGTAQNIDGQAITYFYNLNLQTTGTVKSQTSVDENVTGTLSLNDCEMATNDHNLFVLNTDTGAITRNSGFVSSTGVGRLYRSTNSTNTYSFPVGWNNNGVVNIRPVEFTPSVTDSQAYSVRFAYEDPTLDGYATSTKADNVTSVDSVWYHLLKQHNSTSPSALSIYFLPAVDGNFNSIARWQIIPEWQNLDSANDVSIAAASGGYSRATKMFWTDNGNEPHALINGQEINVPFAFPNVFAPNGSDQVDNNTFHIINEGDLVTVEAMKVFDRWGEVVYDSNRDGNQRVIPTAGTQPTYCWDGKYKGKLQPMGNYVYVATVKILDGGKTKTASGNLALIW